MDLPPSQGSSLCVKILPVAEVCRKLGISEQTYYDGSCIRLRPQRKDHVWSYDMAMERTSDGRPLRILAVIDEYTRECLSLHVARRIRSGDVLDQLYELFLHRGLPKYIRSDNGPEFAAMAVRKWLNRLDEKKGYVLAESRHRIDLLLGEFRELELGAFTIQLP